ncbi:MAG: hypothetical protein ACFFG0_47590 [Candidatus Thorarchaeota archaeon]
MILKISVLIILCFLAAGCGCSGNEDVVKVNPDVPFCPQDDPDNWCAAACVEMIGRWTGWIPGIIQDEYKDCPQEEIIYVCDFDNDNRLNVSEIIYALEWYATGYAEWYEFRWPPEAPVASRSADQHLMTSFCQVEMNYPNLMDLRTGIFGVHAIVITGFTGKGIKEYGYAVADGILFNDPSDVLPGDAPLAWIPI